MAKGLQDEGALTHPTCRPRLSFNQPESEPGLDHPMRTRLVELIRWHDREKPRSLQVAIGPSEIGSPCDRRLAMRIAGVRKVNSVTDPWPAIVGTAIHDWLERCLQRDNTRAIAAGRPPEWITERKVALDPIITGVSDAFHVPTGTVVDWKSMGDAAEKRLADEGPGIGYETQIQGYGLGFSRAGLKVRKVGLMFLSRGGKLSQARYYEWDFDPALAQRAIERVYRIGNMILSLQAQHGTSEVWNMIQPDPTALCGWCPFFQRSSGQASSSGCPGR